MVDLTERLDQYAALITRYHKTLDLLSDAGLRDLAHHISDALSYARFIERVSGAAPTVVDVGSGAGLPGIVIAAALPEAEVHLVERRRRRTAFLELATASLGLDNAQVFGGDVQDLTGVCAHVITAQAVGEIVDLVRLTRHLHRDPCWLVSRRGTGHEVRLDGIAAALDPGAGTPGSAAKTVPAGAEVVEEPLEGRGSLVAVKLPGGQACQPSA